MNVNKKINKLMLVLGMSGVDVKMTTSQSYDKESKRVRPFYGLFVNGQKIGYTRSSVNILMILAMMINDMQKHGIVLGGGG